MKEKELFDYLRKHFYPSLVRSRNKFARWDCYDINGFNRMELKSRTRHYNTLLIERPKFDALIKKCKDNIDTPLYVCYTPKAIYIWNLFRVNLDWETNTRNPKNTYFGGSEKVEKEVAYLDIKDALELPNYLN